MVAAAVGEVVMAEAVADMAVGEAGIIRTERCCTFTYYTKKSRRHQLGDTTSTSCREIFMSIDLTN